MPNAEHVDLVKRLYAAFGGNDAAALLDCVTDDVIFTMPAMPGVPLATRYQGKAGITQFLNDRRPVLQYETFDPKRFLSDQDAVIVIGETAGRVIATGQAFRYEWIQLFEFAPTGLIHRIREYLDTNALVVAFATRANGGGA